MSLITKASEMEIASTIKMMVYGQAGMGKAQPLYCSVLTPNGFVTLADIKVGDVVMGTDGKMQTVLGKFPQGLRPTYKVVTNDGAVTFCDVEHIWNVRTCGGNSRKAGFKNLTLAQMLEKGIICGKTSREIATGRKAMARFEIPVVEPMQYADKDFSIDPYVLGVLIGDGSLTGNVALISNPDKDYSIIMEVASRVEGFELHKNEAPQCPQYSIVRKDGEGEGYIQRIKNLGLDVKSEDKFIPKDYLFGSLEQRVDLLRGLMDTDGYANKNRVYYSTASKQLAADVVELVNSLGGIATIKIYEREGKGVEYRVNVKTPMCPFYLERKADEWSTPKISRYIVDATKVEDTECVCIKVSNDNELFVTDNYIVTHNTTLALSAPKPLLLDFDGGAKRVNVSHLDGVDMVQIHTWNEVQQVFKEDLSAYETIVVDTIGKMMDFIITYKCGTRQPSIRDWGAINQEFTWFTRTVSSFGKNVVFVAHRDTRKDGDDTCFVPALREKSYNNIVTDLDLLGYMEMRVENGSQIRTITFDPTAKSDGKNTCNLPSIMAIPTKVDSKGNAVGVNDFIQKSIIEPYNNMLAVKKANTAKFEEIIAQLKERIDEIDCAKAADEFVSQIDNFEHVGSSKARAAQMLAEKTKSLGLVWNKDTKHYEEENAATA